LALAALVQQVIPQQEVLVTILYFLQLPLQVVVAVVLNPTVIQALKTV
jgi:hypothetical protein